MTVTSSATASRSMSYRLFQAVLALFGLVALVAGAATMLTGAALIPGGGEVSASVDSELRYYSAWYAGVGVLLLWAARRIESAVPVVRGVSAVLIVGASARVLGMLTVGRPHTQFAVLTVVEYAIPLVLLPWHARLIGNHAP